MKALKPSEPPSGSIRPVQPIGSPALTQSALTGQTLLVVEDDPALRDLEVYLLRSCGFQVLESGSVAEALRVAGATSHIHLLLTDFSLPDGNGLDLAHWFRGLHPQAAILLVSGSVAGRGDKRDALERFSMIGKPFLPSELLDRIRVLLADSTPSAIPCYIADWTNERRNAASAECG
jgi:DNA-binding response OmpR family regulator